MCSYYLILKRTLHSYKTKVLIHTVIWPSFEPDKSSFLTFISKTFCISWIDISNSRICLRIIWCINLIQLKVSYYYVSYWVKTIYQRIIGWNSQSKSTLFNSFSGSIPKPFMNEEIKILSIIIILNLINF